MFKNVVFKEKIEYFVRRIRSHSFLQRCAEGSVCLGEMKTYVLQHAVYSSQFTRCLCALMSNLPANDDIYRLAENLFEELGFTASDSTPHYLLYRRMMTALDLPLDGVPPYIETERLIEAMLRHCRNPNPSYGLGALCLGAEALVPSMYRDLLAGFLACGVDESTLEFFRIHISCDDGHSETLYDIMDGIARKDEMQAQCMIEAGETLVRARLEFFSAIERNSLSKYAVPQAV